MTPECVVYRLGRVPYRQAWELQERLARRIAGQTHPPALLLLEHPHIYTFGRRGDPANLLWDAAERQRRGVEVEWVDRGGDVTYHGPGQLVGYPLLPLAPGGLYAGEPPIAEAAGAALPGGEAPNRLPGADFVGYVRKLENLLIDALLTLGVAAGQVTGQTGVWVQPDAISRCRACDPGQRQPPAKLAAIGVKVDARGVSRHGFALNVDPDMAYWQGIIGCGLKDSPVTSLAELLDPPPSLARVSDAVQAAFGAAFHYRMVEGSLDTL